MTLEFEMRFQYCVYWTVGDVRTLVRKGKFDKKLLKVPISSS